MGITIGDSVAVLTRELSVRVLNVSAAGCLIESDRQMTVGTIGRLRLLLGHEEFIEDFEVLRCEAIEGAGRACHIGIRFLWTSPRHVRSIRHAVDRHIAELYALPEITRVM